ncbi:MAG: hypothetical protein N2171_06655 [Clostridia bacterium]|nr:hypothetical protein [Clostridia bacterium]
MKKRITAISMAVGIVMLAGSAFANYVDAGGYTACKNAAKNFLKEQNYTLNMDAQILFDGQMINQSTVKELYDKNGDVKLNHSDEFKSIVNGVEDSYSSESYYQDGERIIKQYTGGERAYESYYVNDEPKPYPYIGNMFGISDEDVQTVDKAVRFGELAADLVVGDLKNNLILVESTDEKDTYAIDLAGYQIPDIINAGLSLVFSQQMAHSSSLSEEDIARNEEANKFMLLGTDPVISSVKGDVSLDKEGRLSSINAEFVLSGTDRRGNAHEAAFKMSVNISDYGTTQPVRFDLSGKKVQRSSTWEKDRIEEIENMLESRNLSKEDRENYEKELESLKASISSSQSTVD